MAQVHTAESLYNMRDVKRRVEVIQKKVADLQDMGVPCAFCYASVRNPGSIFTIGDRRITEVMERYRNKILCNLMDSNLQISRPADMAASFQEVHLILPVLPAPLNQLSRTTLLSMIVGILKDLDIRWSDPKPIWWPNGVPFVPLRSVPENFTGNWMSALREILKSVYSYFRYDVDSYIASELPQEVGETQTTDWDTDEGNSPRHEEKTVVSEPEERLNEVPQTQTTKSHPVISTAPKTSCSRAISSFTVENILMGKQSPSSNISSTSTSSQSPTSTTAAGLPSPTTFGPISSSVVGMNWVSHPPVKYTKFTILSPTAMSDEAKKKKSVDSSPLVIPSIRPPVENVEVHCASAPNTIEYHNGKQVQQVIYASSENPLTSTPVYSFSSLSPSSTTAMKDQLPASTPLSSSAKICTLPVVTMQPSSTGSDGKVLLNKSFPPPQQYVLLMPTSSAAVSSSGARSVQSISSSAEPSTTSINSVKHSSVKTVSFQNPPVATSSSSHSSRSSVGVEQPERANVGTGNRQLNEYNFRLIAPKEKQSINRETRASSGTRGTGRSKLRGHAPQKLRFHMTTVVTKQKKVGPVKGSMTVKSPSTVSGDSQSANPAYSMVHSHSSEGNTPMESMITRSPNVYSSESLVAVKEEAPDPESTQVEEGKRPPPQEHTRLSNGNQDSKTSSIEDLRTTESTKHKNSLDQQSAGTQNRVRATRSYTRRKRELTFHLYEEPGTAFKAKRACN